MTAWYTLGLAPTMNLCDQRLDLGAFDPAYKTDKDIMLQHRAASRTRMLPSRRPDYSTGK